jgi:NADH-quinone oxidoreductase subunit I
MTIGVKVLERPIEDVSYVRATIKGMALTFKHLFQEKVTVQYPEQKWGISPRWARDAPHAHDGNRKSKVRCRAACVRLSVRPTASSSCRAKTRKGTAIR